MLIKSLGNRMYDVFVGKGWKNWVRVEKTSKGDIIPLGWEKHVENDVTTICNAFKRKFIK